MKYHSLKSVIFLTLIGIATTIGLTSCGGGGSSGGSSSPSTTPEMTITPGGNPQPQPSPTTAQPQPSPTTAQPQPSPTTAQPQPQSQPPPIETRWAALAVSSSRVGWSSAEKSESAARRNALDICDRKYDFDDSCRVLSTVEYTPRACYAIYKTFDGGWVYGLRGTGLRYEEFRNNVWFFCRERHGDESHQCSYRGSGCNNFTI